MRALRYYSGRGKEARTWVPGDRTRALSGPLLPGCKSLRTTLWKKRKYTSEWTWANSWVSSVLGPSVLGILGVSKCRLFLNFVAANSDCLRLAESLVPYAFAPEVSRGLPHPNPPCTCGVCFHYNDDIMSFGVGLCSIFPPSWMDLVLACVCCRLLWPPPWEFPAVNYLPLVMHRSEGPGERT